MSKKHPWETCGVWKSESAYLTWLRGQFRGIWMNWPLKNEYKNEQCVPKSEVPQQTFHPSCKFVAPCEQCGVYFPKSKLQVDHIIEAGKLELGKEGEFLGKLLCGKDNMRLLDKECHKSITYATKHDLSFEEAVATKETIQWQKDTPVVDERLFLEGLGYTKEECSSGPKRRALYIKHLLSQEA